jgi:acyl dehydratase
MSGPGMERVVHLDYQSRPSAPRYMIAAMRGAGGRSKAGAAPAITARWLRHRADARELASFLQLSGLPPGDGLPMLYPHTVSFPLQMAILTHPSFPVPIWNVLQVRNRLLQLAPMPIEETFDLTASVAAQRILDKGMEIDLYAVASAEGKPAWEAINTFYVRGKFGEPGTAAAVPPPAAAAPPPSLGPDKIVAHWRMPGNGGFRFGGLTGDYNGIHLSDWYARRFRFPRAFLHPQRVLGLCLARLPARERELPQMLETWLKGPVYYGAQVTLRSAERDGATEFAVNIDGDARPAILGRLTATAPGTRLDGGATTTN